MKTMHTNKKRIGELWALTSSIWEVGVLREEGEVETWRLGINHRVE